MKKMLLVIMLLFCNTVQTWSQVNHEIKQHSEYLVMDIYFKPIPEFISFGMGFTLPVSHIGYQFSEQDLITSIEQNHLSFNNRKITIDPYGNLKLKTYLKSANLGNLPLTSTGGFYRLYALDTTRILKVGGEDFLVLKIEYEGVQVRLDNYFQNYQVLNQEYTIFRKLKSILEITNDKILEKTTPMYELSTFNLYFY